MFQYWSVQLEAFLVFSIQYWSVQLEAFLVFSAQYWSVHLEAFLVFSAQYWSVHLEAFFSIQCSILECSVRSFFLVFSIQYWSVQLEAQYLESKISINSKKSQFRKLRLFYYTHEVFPNINCLLKPLITAHLKKTAH
ncbi:hypothetical protein C4F50_01475 [Flavobacterium sp. KB82]|uniref:Uncharacterized protein n=1 Tax=Flavobacterium hungaricum TaxID=2082725 RepID=A0ABR9TE06_9FLAO|nr:hypothetical protein [Flavobacterium hungaricum]